MVKNPVDGTALRLNRYSFPVLACLIYNIDLININVNKYSENLYKLIFA